MNPRMREIIQSPIYQGEDEEKVYSVTVPTSWGLTPGTLVVKMKDSSGADVTATNLSGAAAAAGQVITWPTMKALEAGEEYRVECKFTTADGDISECWARVVGEV